MLLLNFFALFVIYLLVTSKSGKVFPILYLFLFTYFLQYVFSTYLIYHQYKVLEKQMAIGSDPYFSYALPALGFLFLGVFLFNKDFDLREYLKKIDPVRAARLGYLLLVISYFADALYFVGFESLRSILSFTTYLKYVAAFCFLFSNSLANSILIGVVYFQLLFFALRGGVFIDFFIWSTYLVFFASLRFNFSYWVRFGFIIVAAPALILVQSIKGSYRQETWVNQREGGLDLFTELVYKESSRADQGPFLESAGVLSTVGRLTQGWHLGLTLKHVPEKVAFEEGRELWGDIAASVLPRIFFSDKKTVGTQEKFFKFTGHKLQRSTSVTIGVLGDFYVNFGKWGSFIALFVFGALISTFLFFFNRRYVATDPLCVVWIPFMLSYLIRANNDFYMVFNCMLKGFLIFLVVRFFQTQLWPRQHSLAH